jgi:hypothetical protein
MSSGTTEWLFDVWGSSGSDVFAVGESGTILHYDGLAWSAMSSGTSYWLFGVWSSSGSDVFAVGWNGTILHYDGTDWSAMRRTYFDLEAVGGSSGSDVFAVGQYGTILHYAVNDPPVAANDDYTTIEDTSLTIAAPGVLGNDQDPDGDPLRAVLDSPPLSGTLALDLGGGFTYTPALGFHGVDSFTYRATDAISDSNQATVSVNVEEESVKTIYLPLVMRR